MSDNKDDSGTNYDDMWGEAMGEAKANAAEAQPSIDAFPQLDTDEPSLALSGRTYRTIGAVPVKLTVELGTATLTLKRLTELTQGSVIDLDTIVGESMRIMINGHFFAKGEIVTNDGRFAIRMTEIIEHAERLSQHLLPA